MLHIILFIVSLLVFSDMYIHCITWNVFSPFLVAGSQLQVLRILKYRLFALDNNITSSVWWSSKEFLTSFVSNKWTCWCLYYFSSLSNYTLHIIPVGVPYSITMLCHIFLSPIFLLYFHCFIIQYRLIIFFSVIFLFFLWFKDQCLWWDFLVFCNA